MKRQLAVIGLWGHEVYARTLIEHPQVELVAIAGYQPMAPDIAARLERLRAEQPVPYYEDAESLLERHAVDLAVVMVPPPLNPAIAGLTLARGIDTLCEKPIAGDFASARCLANAWRQGEARFSACLPLTRYGGPFVGARERLAAGELGAVTSVSFTYLASHGPLYTTPAPHYRDADVPAPSLSGGEAAMFSGYGVLAVEALAGAPIASVQASCAGGFYAPYRAQHIEDTAQVALTLADGRPAEMTVGRSPVQRAGADVGFLAIGECGCLDWRQLRDGAPEPGGTAEFIDDFLAAGREGREPALSGADVFGTISVLRAIYLSAHRGEPVAVERLAEPAGQPR